MMDRPAHGGTICDSLTSTDAHPRPKCPVSVLPGSHVTPVTGRVADGEKDRPVLVARPLERILAPRVPVDRVVLVLEEVRAALPAETIHAAESIAERSP